MKKLNQKPTDLFFLNKKIECLVKDLEPFLGFLTSSGWQWSALTALSDKVTQNVIGGAMMTKCQFIAVFYQRLPEQLLGGDSRTEVGTQTDANSLLTIIWTHDLF